MQDSRRRCIIVFEDPIDKRRRQLTAGEDFYRHLFSGAAQKLDRRLRPANGALGGCCEQDAKHYRQPLSISSDRKWFGWDLLGDRLESFRLPALHALQPAL